MSGQIDDDGEDRKGYQWEGDIERTWDVLQEDESGTLRGSVLEKDMKSKRRKTHETSGNIRRGLMRHLYLVVDMSESMEGSDLKPSRLSCTLSVVENFICEYFEQNPISQMGLIFTKDSCAVKISELCGNPTQLCAALRKSTELCGEPSLQNCLELARHSLRMMPTHTSREILVVLASLSTCDPGDIHDTIEALKADHIICSIVGLSCSVFICEKICRETRGNYRVILGEKSFREIIAAHVPPPPALNQMEFTLLKMGFPKKFSSDTLSMCACHAKFTPGGFGCPRCLSKICDIPTDCVVCGLTLVSAPYLARSFHHLFPLQTFVELESSEIQRLQQQNAAVFCRGCGEHFFDAGKSFSLVFKCPNCLGFFCFDCDSILHEQLHNCPGCISMLSLH